MRVAMIFKMLFAVLLVFLNFTWIQGVPDVLNHPYYNEQCVNVSGPCKDIRECDLADAILALGGWPTVCGWDEPMEWPKVCCGMTLNLGEPLKKNFVQQMRKGSMKETEDIDSRGGNSPRCVLPLVPQPDLTPEEGVRFGNTPHSRQEFYENSEFMSSIMNASIFAMEFKTTGDSGVMFYVASITSRRDYLGLFMQEGKIVYVFNCGMGSAVISSHITYNDGQWHRVVFLRNGREGELIIDDQELSGASIGKAIRIDNLDPPLYLGGLAEEASTRARYSLQGVSSSFPGCIRNVEAQNELLKTEILTSTNISQCSSKVEDGTFFSVDGGYLVLYEKYRVGQRISISLDVKPRNLSGVMMAVHGKEDYLVLQLAEGSVHFTVDSGSGPITAKYTPAPNNQLCDGEFHTIEAESMSNNQIALTVDGVRTEEALDLEGVSSIDTFDPLYIGGLPDWSKGGVLTSDPFVGCLRDIVLDQEAAPMYKSRLVGHVTLNSCPTA